MVLRVAGLMAASSGVVIIYIFGKLGSYLLWLVAETLKPHEALPYEAKLARLEGAAVLMPSHTSWVKESCVARD